MPAIGVADRGMSAAVRTTSAAGKIARRAM